MTAEPLHQPLLRFDRLNVTFSTPHGEVNAVRDLSLEVAAGECLGVVGESGAGKSQAFMAALGLLAPNGRPGGRVFFKDTSLLGLASGALDRIRGSRIGLVFQDPMTSLTPHLRIEAQLAEPLVRHLGLSRKDAGRRALELLQQVHVTDPQRRLRQYPHELSGGMRQRVMIAIALSCQPELLIADEPTTALDATIQAQILGLLAELKSQRGMAMILITHDLAAVAGIADRVAVMRAGQLVESADVRSIFKNPVQPYTRSLLAAVPRTGAFTAGAVSPASEVTLALEDVRVEFNIPGLLRSRRLRAVDRVSVGLAAGEAVGIVGESGSGKSTLARAALRLLPHQSGRVVWLGQSVDALSQRKLRPLRRAAQIVFQDPLASLDPRLSVREIVAEPLRVHRPELDPAARDNVVLESLRQVGLDVSLRNRFPHQLSGGQCQRVGIARAMVVQPRVLICDEPVSALDVTVQQQIVSVLLALKQQYGLSILFISHNLAVVGQICERVLVMYLGRMMELAPARELFTHPLHPYTRELLDSAPIPDPDVQPGRLGRALSGEAPSPLAPPSGCVYRTRCRFAIEICRLQVPVWETAPDRGGQVACHRWKELAGTLSCQTPVTD